MSPFISSASGRLVPKKGWLNQMAIYRAAAEAGLTFMQKSCGSGPQNEHPSKPICANTGCQNGWKLLGQLPYTEVLPLYEWADASSSPAKLPPMATVMASPNVLGEAMAPRPHRPQFCRRRHPGSDFAAGRPENFWRRQIPPSG